MTSCKLIIKNVRKNIRDYLIYFLTLMISVSVFYAFNSISDQPAFAEMGMTKTLLYDQFGILLSTLTVLIAVVLAFLIIYANQFLLKRRKKELGLYMVLGMKKGRISRIFAGETFCVGVIALVTGLCLGVALSQGISLVALKLFAIELSKFQLVFSMGAFQKTALCFAVIFLLVMTFNVWSVSSVQLIDLLTAGRKNETSQNRSCLLPVLLFLVSLACILSSGVMFYRNGILPSRENRSFQVAGILLVAGTFIFFYSLSTVFVQILRANSNVYLRGLNTFLVRQIGSKIRTNYFIMTIVCGLLTVTICAVSVGVGTALAMNELSGSATPYDLNVLSNVSMDGDSSILEYLASKDADLSGYAENMEQISIYEADFTYGSLFEGQNVELWPIDEGISDSGVSVLAVSDFNRALKMQGKEPVALTENQYLLNCNYKGTFQYVEKALESHADLVLAGIPLQRASDTVLEETYFMTSVGNNDRGTLIVPDAVAHSLTKDVNVLLVQYRPDADSDAVLQKMIPIGLDDTYGYRYAEKNMMYDMFYGLNALISFLCCYIGLIFLVICAALLALKQLTETTDNIYRYGLLQKLGAKKEQINRTLLSQTAIFFAAPLAVAGIFSAVLMGKAMEIVEEFMNIHISTNMVFTVVLFLVVYGSYFLATYLSCKRMVVEHQNKRMEE
ncbi:ABC transporter permease [Parablautia intestinalis]|uniref:ABC transporter permease n=1 Tax=Parablautia intestinalis TaxID=2320100 RepID=A0A3A9ATY2_9FIRM|nr:ABC transporter permease [Parablautia intestinalis]RKI91031.1 ABC transporter permease [Parablautia intestinalis]